jgi:hypothetical protein
MRMAAAQRVRERHLRAAYTRIPALLLLVFSLTLLGAGSASAISRNTVLARAQSWVDSPVPYSQAKRHLGYRTDCSGYVSMCWKTGTSWSTRSFHTVTHRITTAQLKPGDAMLKAGYHIRLFYGWVDDTHTSYVAYEAGTLVGTTSIRSMPNDLASGFHPVRYNHISDSAASANLLRNGSFDVWAKSWGASAGLPVWWNLQGSQWRNGGSQGQTVVVHRKNTYKTARNSLQLTNSSSSAGTFAQMSQTVTVTAGAMYTLSAWAKTATPAGIALRVSYLGKAGDTIAGSGTTGDAWGVNNSTFKKLSETVVAPSGAVRAVVTLALAGGTSTVGTTTVSGTSVVLDAISLARARATIGIKADATSARIGKSVTLSGSVTPTAAIGATVTIYVQRPGKAWARVSGVAVDATGGVATWRGSYSFKRGMRTGVYTFKAVIPAVAGWLGATSKTVSVRVK